MAGICEGEPWGLPIGNSVLGRPSLGPWLNDKAMVGKVYK